MYIEGKMCQYDEKITLQDQKSVNGFRFKIVIFLDVQNVLLPCTFPAP